MRDLKKRERIALDAVVARFSATWEDSSGPHDADLLVAGQRVGVDVTGLARRHPGEAPGATLRLRFDKVVRRLVADLQGTLAEIVPDDTTVLLTVTAPIRLPAKTAAALTESVTTLLGQHSAGRDTYHTVHGNRVRIRFLSGTWGSAPNVIGFVHNADSDARLLLNITEEVLELVRAEADQPGLPGKRWLVGLSTRESSRLGAYRSIYAELSTANDPKTVLIVFADRQVGMLSG